MKQAVSSSSATQRWRIAAAIVLFGLVFVLLACGPAASPPAPAATTAPAVVTPGAIQPAPTAAQAQPKKGGSLVVRFWTAEPTDTDPYLNTSFRVQEFAAFFYSRLLKFDAGPNIGANAFIPTGDLAEKWDISKDGLTYTFYLRKNAKWQNKPPLNGRAVTADDVVYSYNRFIKDGVQKAVFTVVKEVKKIDDYTVAFILKEVSAPFENTIASPIFWIVPKEVVEADGDLRKNHVGSGPFIFDKFEKGVQVVGKRNPDYYITGAPLLDEIVLLIIPEDATAVAGLRSKQIDINGVAQLDRKSLLSTNPEIKMLDFAQNLIAFMYWRIDKPPFNDVRVRQSVALALDRDEYVKVLYEGNGIYNAAVAAGLESWWLNPLGPDFGPNAKYFKRNIAEAKRLLAEAGYPNGLKVPMIATLNAYGNTFNNGVELVIKQLKEAGIEATLQPQDYAAYITSTYLGKFEGGSMVWGYETPVQEPNDYLFNMYHPKGARNHASIDDPALTDMIEKQRVTVDRNERKKLIYDIQRYLAEKQYYAIGSIGNGTTAVQPWVKDFYLQTDYGRASEIFLKVWLDNKPQ